MPLPRGLSAGWTGHDLPTVALTYGLGIAGGLAAKAAHLPLPMLVGSLLAVGTAALALWRPFGRPVGAPQALRTVFVPVIGVAIGSAFHPGIGAEMARWWPSLLLLAAFLPVAHVAVFLVFRATGRIDPATAWYGAAPGGMIENVEMGLERGAEVRMLTMLQFLRLIVVILLVPLTFSVIEGHAVGSAGGAALPGAAAPAPAEAALLAAAAVLGALAGIGARLPAGHVTGPILLSALLHVTGLVRAAPPQWIIEAAQVVVGVSLGVRFAGMARAEFAAALGLACLNVAAVCGAALALAFAMHGALGQPAAAVFLAFAPGGLVEMGLIALSLNLSVAYVTVHHVARIVIAVAVSRALGGRMAGARPPP